MSSLQAISLEPNSYNSSEEKIKTVDYLKNGIAFELAKRGVFAGSENSNDRKALEGLRVGSEIILPEQDKYVSPFADAEEDRDRIISIFNSMNKPNELNDKLYGDMLNQLDASGPIDDELGNKILKMAEDPDKVFLTAYSNWRDSSDRHLTSGWNRKEDCHFRYILKDENNHYLLELSDRDNSRIGEHMKIYDFKEDCMYENIPHEQKKWFPAIYRTLKEQGLFPSIPRLTTKEIVCNREGLGDKYIQITKDLDERIKNDTKRYSIMKAAPMLDNEFPKGDQGLQETTNDKQSTLGAESETKESGLNPATKVSDRNSTETVPLRGFERSTRLSRDFSDNHKKVDLWSNIISRIDKMEELGIFNEEQALSLKQNIGTQSSKIYLNRQNDLLGTIAYLADYAKNNGKSFGPDQVNSLITDKSIIDDQIKRGLITGEIDGKPSAALKEKQLGTLDRIEVLGFTRKFLERPDMGVADFHKINLRGKAILENTSF